ncbi:MAG: hypothetical protein ABTA24_14420 [Arthrobacter sp.]
MKKNMMVGAVFVAGALVLAGCGSEGAADDGADTAATQAQAAPTAVESTSAADGNSQGQYTPAELQAALAAVKDKEGLTGAIADDAAVRAQLPAATDALDGITITPEACAELATDRLAEKLETGNFAIMQLSATDTVTLISYEDESFIEGQIASNEKQVAECAEFQMEAGGQTFSTTGQEVPASSSADTTQAFSVVTTGEGVSTEVIQVAGFSGTTVITVSMTDPADAAGAAAAGGQLVDAILAELKG